MAKVGYIEVRGTTEKGLWIINPRDSATAQLLAEAMEHGDLEVRASWPRRRGGRAYPKLKLTDTKEQDNG